MPLCPTYLSCFPELLVHFHVVHSEAVPAVWSVRMLLAWLPQLPLSGAASSRSRPL
jgi:hypothetical protein